MKIKTHEVLFAIVFFVLGFATGMIYMAERIFSLISDFLARTEVDPALLNQMIRYGMERMGIF